MLTQILLCLMGFGVLAYFIPDPGTLIIAFILLMIYYFVWAKPHCEKMWPDE